MGSTWGLFRLDGFTMIIGVWWTESNLMGLGGSKIMAF